MKKALYLLLFVVGLANGQIVNIPDSNFKTFLLNTTTENNMAYDVNNNSIAIDANNDDEIQISEAQSVYQLYLTFGNINNLEGINSFTNLRSLYCNSNQLTTLDVSSLTNLQNLDCSTNNLTTINLNGLTNLTWFDCSFNQFATLNLTELTGLVSLLCMNNSLLTSINLDGLINLEDIDIRTCALTNLNVSSLTNLINLKCDYNQLTSLDLSGLANLETVYVYENQLTNLNLNGLTNLTILYCPGNQLTTIDLGGLVNLNTLVCPINQLTSFDTTDLINLNWLNCGYNNLTSINLDGSPQLSQLTIDNNFLTTLDISNLTDLTFLACRNNQLTSLFIKNNNPNWFLLEFENNPNLAYICADEEDLIAIEQKIISYGYSSTCHANNYCSFNPGGNYNTITGTVTFDADNNGCDEFDTTFPNLSVNINDGTNSGGTFVDADGNYIFYTDTGNFTISPQVEIPEWFLISPESSIISFSDTNNNSTSQNFCIIPNGVHPDVEVVIAPTTVARPGFDAHYKIVFKNKGNQTLSVTINMAFDDDKSDFVMANPIVDNLSVNTLSWNYSNLLPFESRAIEVVLNINSPIETPAVNIGDQLDYTVTINPIVGDEIPDDNVFFYKQTVVGSFDPNEIICLEGDIVPPSEIGEYLHYIVSFENTGNYYAENVVVKLDIDPTKFDITTLQLLNTSHPSYTRITGNKVEFIFEGINLDATSGNPPVGGHGNVLFKIRSKEDLGDGDYVSKRANIYFDYNSPIDTNIAFTTFETLSNSISTFDESITVFPNPTNSNVNINSKFNIKSVELYDIQGRILETAIENSNESIIDVSKRQSGIYFLKITTEDGSKVEKIVKE